MRRRKPPTPPEPKSSDRLPGIVVSLLAAAGFGAFGVMAIWNHAVAWPGRNGQLLRSTGSAADLVGWVLLAGAAASLSQLAMVLKPGKPGAKWAGSIFLVWGLAAAGYYLIYSGK